MVEGAKEMGLGQKRLAVGGGELGVVHLIYFSNNLIGKADAAIIALPVVSELGVAVVV